MARVVLAESSRTDDWFRYAGFAGIGLAAAKRFRKSSLGGMAVKSRGLLLILAISCVALPATSSPVLTTRRDGTTPIATGVVRGLDGRSIAGATVKLLAWQPNTVIHRSNHFDLPIVTRTKTDQSGRFQLRIPKKLDLRPMVNVAQGSLVNFEAVAMSGHQFAVRSFSASITAPNATVSLELVTRLKNQVQDGPDPLAGKNLQGPYEVIENNYDGCGAKVEQVYDPKWSVLGAIYNTVNGATTTWTYQNGSSTSLGVAVSNKADAYGQGGGWEESGTSSDSNSSTLTYPSQAGVRTEHLDTTFIPARYDVYCWDYQPINYTAYYEWRQVQDYDWAANQRFITIASSRVPVAKYCVHLLIGAHYKQDKTSNQTWSTGWDLSGIVGFSVKSTTGYSVSMSETFVISSDASRYLCGTNGRPGQTQQPPVRLVWQQGGTTNPDTGCLNLDLDTLTTESASTTTPSDVSAPNVC